MEDDKPSRFGFDEIHVFGHQVPQERYEKDLYRVMGGKPDPEQPSQHQDDTFSKLLAQPVENPVSRKALDAMFLSEEIPMEQLRAARDAQAREAHNAQVDQKKAKKRQVKELAKQAGIPTATLKRMLGRK
jgi:hypothetical protein